MKFDDLKDKYIDDAVKMAQAHYDKECEATPALYKKDYKDKLADMLGYIFQHGMGKVALENNQLIGFLGFYAPLDEQFGHVTGSFSPVFANAYGGKNRATTASRLFEEASKAMVDKGILSYTVAIYAHDQEVLEAYSFNGFGYRCADAIRIIEKQNEKTIKANDLEAYTFEEIDRNQAGNLLDFHNNVRAHLGQSPTYYPVGLHSLDTFLKNCEEDKSRLFIASFKGHVVGYYELISTGETFITNEEDYLHIVGAYINKDHRGKGVLAGLLDYILEKLKDEGYSKLGVDCETTNPPAYRYWKKHFDYYTYSLVRRLDERIVE